MASKRWLTALMLALVAPASQASLNIFACEPEWGDLAGALAPEADITVAGTAISGAVSVAVTLTVELAGIYVVFTSLIASPLMLCHLAGRSVLAAVLVAFAGQGAGLMASAIFDLPAGPAVVLAIVLASLAVLLVARRPARIQMGH